MNIKKTISPIYKKLFPDWYRMLKKECSGLETALDLGCGYNSPIQYTGVPNKTGVDAYEPYIEASRAKNIHQEYIKADLKEVDFPEKSFDLVFCSELIEHLKKEDGLKLLANMDRWAKKKIILTTPNGFLPQGEYDDNGLQEHLSGWTTEEFRKLGFKVYGINGLKYLKGEEGRIKFKPRWLWRFISDCSRSFTFRCPKLSFQLFAVKEIKNQQ
jgi:2-polyprenyl-3-methyl-5-hydroxy-6-metoxy-1,4-benzoquinol methylase